MGASSDSTDTPQPEGSRYLERARPRLTAYLPRPRPPAAGATLLEARAIPPAPPDPPADASKHLLACPPEVAHAAHIHRAGGRGQFGWCVERSTLTLKIFRLRRADAIY